MLNSATMQLHFQHYPEHLSLSELATRTPLVIIPGLFGSTSNWRSFAKQLSAKIPVIVIDPRNHGRSPHAESHSYADLVQDLVAFCDDRAIPKIQLCGHS
ncbi:MAG: alpha/beta fold hydrolase, partial [Gammaproteobacteria bacterium]|nr:alpha/beta fold hydrolase [Gammaproteobacteria bacterium]